MLDRLRTGKLRALLDAHDGLREPAALTQDAGEARPRQREEAPWSPARAMGAAPPPPGRRAPPASAAWPTVTALLLLGCTGQEEGPRCFLGDPGPGQPQWTLAVEGQPVTLQVLSPLLPCETDAVTVAVEVLDPSSAPVVAQLGALDRQEGAVRTTVSFVPAVAGDYSVRVVFEPSLGAVRRPLAVAQDRRAVAPRVLPLPQGVGCTEAFWLQSGALVCLESRTGQVTVVRDGQALASFKGASVTVAADVIWSVDPVARVLERRVLVDGAVRLEGSLAGFDGLPGHTIDTPDRALRRQGAGRAASVWWDGVALQQLGLWQSPDGFFEGEVLWQVTAFGQLCWGSSCLTPGIFLGVTRGAVWAQDARGAVMIPRPFTATRPRVTFATGDVVLQPAALPSSLSPGTDRLDGRLVLPVATSAGPRLQLWLAGELLGLDDDFLLRPGDAAGSVALFAR